MELISKISAAVICIVLMFRSCVLAQLAHQKIIPIKVVVVTTFEIGEDIGDTAGEFQNWVEKLPLPTVLPFPQGNHHLRYNSEKQVLGIVTGEGPSRMASSITALANDKRFDLSHAYWILAGIAGVDPHVASLASAAWARYVVDGDLTYEIAAREIPSGWTTGYVAYGRTIPFQLPRPPVSSSNGANEFVLNAGLAGWAFHVSSTHVKLADDDNLQRLRAKYAGFPKAQQPPLIFQGDVLAAGTFWIGSLLNTWAENWVNYWSDGRASFAMSAEEDSAHLQALTFLSQAKMVDINRVMVMRSASDFTAPPPGQTAAQLLAADEDHTAPSAVPESMNSAFEVGSVVVNELVRNWSSYRDHIPGAQP
jgi:purine nucleoside permease